jgi:DNA mismatch repair protein MutH
MAETLSREEALEKLKQLEGTDLRKLADQYGITVFHTGGGFNKGWLGLVIESYLGLIPNSRQEADFGTWELKVVPLVHRAKRSGYYPKETMAITMLNPQNVAEKPFESSHLYTKLRKMVVIGRTFVDRQESSSTIIKAEIFDFDDHEDT